MKIKITLVCILTLTMLKCTCSDTTEDNNVQVIKIDFSQNLTNIHDIGIIDDVQILNLENSEIVVGEIDKIVRHNNRIYLLDKRKTNSIIIYDDTGRLINVISKKGDGPEEYIQLTDILINPFDSTLNLISRVDKKIIKYNLDGTHLLGVEKLPKSFSQLSKTKSGYVGYMANYTEDYNAPQNVWTISNSLQIENSYFDIDKTWDSRNLSGEIVFSNYDTTTYYIQQMDFSIYTIKDNAVYKRYFFDLGEIGWPQQSKKYDQVDEILQVDRDRYIQRFYNFQETTNFLIIKTLCQGQYLLGIYDKNNEKTYAATLNSYTDKYLFSFGKIINFDENSIYTLVNASEIKKMLEGKDKYNDYESEYPEQIRRLREKFGEDNVTEDGNPFLVIYNIRQ